MPIRTLRLWPGIAAAVLLVLSPVVLPVVMPGANGMLGIMGSGVAILLWWMFFSRAPWAERLGAIGLIVVVVAATFLVIHPSIENGMMGMMLPIYSVPVQGLALVVWAVSCQRVAGAPRHAALVLAVLLAAGLFTVVRTAGITSSGIGTELHWRWTPTPEELLLASAPDGDASRATLPAPASSLEATKTAAGRGDAAPLATSSTTPTESPAAAAATPTGLAMSEPEAARAEWPGFRGPGRDSVIHGVRIESDWAKSPPAALWHRPIGPGWSSFAIHGDLFYTQEQRGDDEIVACYKVSTGEPVWKHRDAVRFWESNGGAGPRATPTLSHGRVYALGATGVLNALDARTGAVVWSRNAAADTHAELPGWGFTSSPLVVNDLVIVAPAGAMAAYDLATGKPRWVGPHHDGSYSSPQLVSIDGVEQVVMLSGAGATGVAPADGKLLWEHSWPGGAIVQPGQTADGDVLINSMSATGGTGIRRIAIAREGAGWKTTERWTSTGLKPYFNDFVVHKGHAFGFDGNILSCIDLEDGKRNWKGGRYGNGQLVLLPDQDLLLVLSEDGELALVSALPDKFTEVARVPALEGKTWNHPVLVGDRLLIRNGQEMAAFRLSLAAAK